MFLNNHETTTEFGRSSDHRTTVYCSLPLLQQRLFNLKGFLCSGTARQLSLYKVQIIKWICSAQRFLLFYRFSFPARPLDWLSKEHTWLGRGVLGFYQLSVQDRVKCVRNAAGSCLADNLTVQPLQVTMKELFIVHRTEGDAAEREKGRRYCVFCWNSAINIL